MKLNVHLLLCLTMNYSSFFVKYLGICITAGKDFKCSMENVKIKFYRVFSAIYSKCGPKGIDSEIVTVELMKLYCLPFIMYATINMLDIVIMLLCTKFLKLIVLE